MADRKNGGSRKCALPICRADLREIPTGPVSGTRSSRWRRASRYSSVSSTDPLITDIWQIGKTADLGSVLFRSAVLTCEKSPPDRYRVHVRADGAEHHGIRA